MRKLRLNRKQPRPGPGKLRPGPRLAFISGDVWQVGGSHAEYSAHLDLGVGVGREPLQSQEDASGTQRHCLLFTQNREMKMPAVQLLD